MPEGEGANAVAHATCDAALVLRGLLSHGFPSFMGTDTIANAR